MSDVIVLPLVFLIGVVTGTVGALVGGGSLLSIPMLIVFGLPPQVAIATDRFAGLGAAATALTSSAGPSGLSGSWCRFCRFSVWPVR